MTTFAITREQDSFFRELSESDEKALILDYDGTLAPFCVERQSAAPYPGVMELIAAIMSTHTRVVFVSGRPVMELSSLIPIVPTPEIWGSHGLEHLRRDGSYELAEMPVEALQVLAEIDDCLDAQGLLPIAEFKPGATALHWRGLDDASVNEIRKRVSRLWIGFQPQHSLMLSEFDGGVEFRLRLRDKGDAVKCTICELDKRAPIAYLGDDYTDEDAFRVLKTRGLSALVRHEYRSTAADIWLRPPEDVLQFLGNWLLACGEEVR